MPEKEGPLEITSQLTISDLRRAATAIAVGHRTPWRWAIYFVSGSASCSVLFWMSWSLQVGERATVYPAILWGVLFFPMLMILLWFLLPYLTVRRATLKNSKWEIATVWRFYPDCVETCNSLADTKIQWAAFLKIRETRQQFLIFYQENLAYVLPKRCFHDEAHINAFREVVRSVFSGTVIFLK